MQTNRYLSMLFAVVLGVTLLAQTAWAESIKQRMKARLPVIAELKQNGIVGENNRGYLSYVGSVKARPEVVNSENRDRKTVYTRIAEQHNTKLEVVERNRADQLARRAAPGTYVQESSGKWIKK